jgi:hypothetical protein
MVVFDLAVFSPFQYSQNKTRTVIRKSGRRSI